jgi:hypothetical protein
MFMMDKVEVLLHEEINRVVQSVWSYLVKHGAALQEEDYSEKTENEIFQLIIISLQGGDIEREESCKSSDSYRI